MTGRWIGFTALGCLVGSILLNEIWGMVPGMLLAIGGLVLARRGLNSKARFLSLAVLILSIVLLGAYLTVLFLGADSMVMDNLPAS